MSANAPYYQVRASQFINTTNCTNDAVHTPIVPGGGNYDLAASAAAAAAAAAASRQEQVKSPVHSKPAAHRNSADHPYEDSHNLSELLEAASSVATGLSMQADTMPPEVEVDMAAYGSEQRKRASSSPTGDISVEENVLSSKRQRVHVPTDPQLQGVKHSVPSNFDNGGAPRSNELMVMDSRTASVHSAAALFRRSSERTSRKCTRPPMSKLFMSLQLSPEDFLQLQAQAKMYMLDTAHPERQNCVGNRGKGDTDMVKLRLFNCVRNFLNEKAGEQFFGEHVKKPGERDTMEAAWALGEERVSSIESRLTWPRDGNKIISLVTPLMRRMVTNERQRQYAIEARRGSSKKGKEGSVEAVVPRAIAGQDGKQQTQSPLDPNLAQQALHSQPTSPAVRAQHAFLPSHDNPKSKMNASISTCVPLPSASSVEPNLSHINIFLVLASHDGKPSIKLEEKRIFAEHPTHLTFYNWNDFVKEVLELLCKAQSRHSELRRQPMPCENSIGPNRLRGLAAAANSLQSEMASSDHTGPDSSGIAIRQDSVGSPSASSSSRKDPSLVVTSAAKPSATLASQASPSFSESKITHSDARDGSNTVLPRHVIKTIGPSGWSVIDTEYDWYHILREKAFAVWADGVCNILVELVDISPDDLSSLQ